MPFAFFQTLLNSKSVGVFVIVAVSVSPAAIVWSAFPPVTAKVPSCFQPDGIVLVGSLTVYLIPSGISVITADTRELIVITAKGRFNKISPAVLPISNRNKAGNRVIKLTKGDYIKNIFTCSENSIIRVTRSDEVCNIDTESIPMGSSVSTGVKLCKDGVIKAELIRK